MFRTIGPVTREEANQLISAIIQANQAYHLWLQRRIKSDALDFVSNELAEQIRYFAYREGLEPALRAAGLCDYHLRAYELIEKRFSTEQKSELDFFSNLLNRATNRTRFNLGSFKTIRLLSAVSKIFLFITILLGGAGLVSLALMTVFSQLGFLNLSLQFILMMSTVGSSSLFVLALIFTLLTRAIVSSKMEAISRSSTIEILAKADIPAAQPEKLQPNSYLIHPLSRAASGVVNYKATVVVRPSPSMGTSRAGILPTSPAATPLRVVGGGSSFWQSPRLSVGGNDLSAPPRLIRSTEAQALSN